ncbi:MAG: cysteine hydrolase [Burkholderiales bacterium]|nr:cysteine hydrolase [Burkholderiales bacterium]
MSLPPPALDRPALIVVDMQNDFVRRGAPLEVPDARLTLPTHQRLIAAFRAVPAPVLYTRFIATPEPSLLWNWSPQCAPPTSMCRPGVRRRYDDVQGERDAADVVDEIAPQPGDTLIDKYGYGAFHGTRLSDTLRQRGVRTLIITGTVTQICVEETAREAFHHGFETIVVADAVSSFAPDLHAATLKNFAMKFGWVENADDVLLRLRTIGA